jgi:predicted transcriptional regulator YdeE
VTQPKLIDLDEKRCIGYMIQTSFKGNQKKRDIPPFWHDIYDNDKLSILKTSDDENMYCIFDFHPDGKDFDYYVAVEKTAGASGEGYSEIMLSKGKYVQVEFMKRNQTAAALIAGYIKKIWIELNGYEERDNPTFILYDERFDQNYKKHGCKGKDYLGDPIATLHIPVAS